MHETAGRTTSFFPLRTNVEYFALPEGYLSLEARLKEASLLYDQLILEAGMYMAFIGPKMSIDLWVPYEQMTADMLEDRFPVTGGQFLIKIDEHEIVSPTERRFISEFHSMLRTLPMEEASWMSVLNFSLDPKAKDFARTLAESVLEGAESAMPEGSASLKWKLIGNLTQDLVLSSAIRSAVSMDPLHSPILERVAAALGGGAPSKGFVALKVMVPRIGGLSWDAVLEERDEPSVRAFREKVFALEELARQGVAEGATEEDIRREVKNLLIDELAQEVESRFTTPGRVAKGVTKEAIVEMILFVGQFGVPGISVPVKILEGMAELDKERKSWIASFLRLRRV